MNLTRFGFGMCSEELILLMLIPAIPSRATPVNNGGAAASSVRPRQ